ncbi:MAG: 6-phosphogluconolactonase [Hyphomicrobiales bacterium]|nr:6-phosphogluconolactonase [Hyphomicrobiales bacterium]
MSGITLNKFHSSLELAHQLADRICCELETAITERGSATLVVSGGSTPKMLFQVLSSKAINWSDVIITLVDERWVDENDKRSNAMLVKRHLLVNNAANARFVPLFHPGDIDQEIYKLEMQLQSLPLPFDVVVLGMGSDGHTASFFPGGDNLDAAVDEKGKNLLSSMRAPGAVESRITFNLPPLLQSRFLALHIEGKEKLDVLEHAMDDGDANSMPVRHIIRKSNKLEIFWA